MSQRPASVPEVVALCDTFRRSFLERRPVEVEDLSGLSFAAQFGDFRADSTVFTNGPTTVPGRTFTRHTEVPCPPPAVASCQPLGDSSGQTFGQRKPARLSYSDDDCVIRMHYPVTHAQAGVV